MSALSEGVDAALELSIGGSFTRVGAALRRRLEDWDTLDDVDLSGRVVVMTGATSGLGLCAAQQFASMGATLTIVARNEAKVIKTCEALRQESGNERVGHVVADTGDLEALRRAADELRARHAQTRRRTPVGTTHGRHPRTPLRVVVAHQ